MHVLALFLALSLGQAPEREFHCEEGNYKICYPRTWQRTRPPDQHVEFAIQRGVSRIVVFGAEAEIAPEQLREEFRSEVKTTSDSVKEISRTSRKMGGEPAETTVFEVRRAGVRAKAHVTVFTRQGMAYRIIWMHLADATPEFARDHESILDSFAFLEERKEWLTKQQGKPARTALLGGLASFELNRPRWIETTFDEPPDYGFIDSISYEFISKGAWVTVRARETTGDAAAELEALRHLFASAFQNVRTKATSVRGPRGEQPTFEMTGEANDYQYLSRVTVLVEEGLAVQIILQCLPSHEKTTRRDWEQLVGKFRLQSRSKPEEPPAFPVRRFRPRQPPEPGLDVFLGKATRLLSELAPGETILLAADGKSALRRGDEGTFIETFGSRKREPVALKTLPQPRFYGLRRPGGIAWSRDGKKLAEALEEEVRVAAVDGRDPRDFRLFATELAFGPGDEELLACVPARKPSEGLLPVPYASSRLEGVSLKDGARRVLVDFPLSRVSHPAASPDGKWIALSCNRDYPRTAETGGHVYVCAADRSALRQLTRDPEEILSIAWAADGKSLFVVRRRAAGERGAVGPGGLADLYRVALDTGEAVNLTRSGRIHRAWCVDHDVLLEINDWELPPTQRGLFRISVAELEKATAGRPSPPIADHRVQARAVAAKVEEALGGTWQSAVPTPELLDKVARAFADAVRQHFGHALDFSADSLDRLPALVRDLDLGSARERALVLGLGAYYGETLRKVAQAEWRLQPRPFAEWTPAQPAQGNSLVEVILPFSDCCRLALGSEHVWIRDPEDLLKRVEGQKLLLVYPPVHAEEAVDAATPKEYREARRLLDAGEVKPALDSLARELERRPRNGPLVREVIALCESVRLADAAQALTRRAVEAGNEVPELLIRRADELAKTDPKQALELYRKAVQGDWAPAEAYLKLGRHYAELGQSHLAEACMRRAYRGASEAQKREIRKLLGIPESEPEHDRSRPINLPGVRINA